MRVNHEIGSQDRLSIGLVSLRVNKLRSVSRVMDLQWTVKRNSKVGQFVSDLGLTDLTPGFSHLPPKSGTRQQRHKKTGFQARTPGLF